MSELQPADSMSDISERWPGALTGDAKGLRRFLFHADRHFPTKLLDTLLYEWELTPEESFLRDSLENLRDSSEGSRLQRATNIANYVACRLDAERTVGTFDPSSPDDALETALSFFDRWPAWAKFNFASSPLYPNGRTEYTPIDYRNDKVRVPYRAAHVIRFGTQDQDAPDALTDFIEYGYRKRKALDRITKMALEAPEVDKDRLKKLHTTYGAKAADTIVFAEHLKTLEGNDGDTEWQQPMQVPDFIPVDTGLYKLWQNDRLGFEARLADLNSAAVALVSGPDYLDEDDTPIMAVPRLVVIRSSAVNSEDGEDITGAGIYDSVAVDPRDGEAFQKAVEQVFASTNSPRAVNYRQQHGIDSEEMGLLVQIYCDAPSRERGDTTPFGTVNSHSTHPNLMEVETQKGSLVFDRERIRRHLLASAESADILHTIPDHTIDGIGGPDSKLVHSAVHAAMLAELFFAKPVQVEFYGDNILQVRPLPNLATEMKAVPVEFPENIEPIDWCRATGVGDVILRVLDNRARNNQNAGVVIFWDENRFTSSSSLRGHEGAGALPAQGAAIIINNDGYSGHAQMLCREKGLLCLFPDVGTMLNIDDKLHEMEQQGADKPMLRIISDGYKGAIYLVDPHEQPERQALL